MEIINNIKDMMDINKIKEDHNYQIDQIHNKVILSHIIILYNS